MHALCLHYSLLPGLPRSAVTSTKHRSSPAHRLAARLAACRNKLPRLPLWPNSHMPMQGDLTTKKPLCTPGTVITTLGTLTRAVSSSSWGWAHKPSPTCNPAEHSMAV